MQEKLKKISLVITDVDGILTDGFLYYSEHGETLKRFYARDGLGITILQAAGIKVAALSGRDSPTLRRRLADLKIELFILGSLDKKMACNKLIADANVTAEQTAYIGDDTVDLPAFEICGVNFTIYEAADYIKKQADYVTQAPGGRGAFREIADKILVAQGKEHLISTASGFLSVVHKSAQ